MIRIIKCFLFLMSLNSFAEVRYVEKNQPAPYSGYLFDVEAEKKNRLSLVDLDYFKLKSESLERESQLYKKDQTLLIEQKNLWQENSNRVTEQLIKERDQNLWTKLFYFGLGVLAGKLVYDVAK